ncbi:hypothetical protein F183_A26740 [Bryobacterales bacterium F-183]|nr:hypothetical protein F183_A26740 [Bryobacterales bacterium F-183]
MRHPIYLIFGSLLTGYLAWTEYRGGGFASVTRLKNVPRSIRDNPGAYRSHYSYIPRYMGGK